MGLIKIDTHSIYKLLSRLMGFKIQKINTKVT